MVKYIKGFIAQKDHIIVQNDERYEFIEGKKYSKVPTKWEQTLITEKVIKKGVKDGTK